MKFWETYQANYDRWVGQLTARSYPNNGAPFHTMFTMPLKYIAGVWKYLPLLTVNKAASAVSSALSVFIAPDEKK